MTADVDAVLCRWGIMLSLDPSAAFMHRLFDKGPRFASPNGTPSRPSPGASTS